MAKYRVWADYHDSVTVEANVVGDAIDNFNSRISRPLPNRWYVILPGGSEEVMASRVDVYVPHGPNGVYYHDGTFHIANMLPISITPDALQRLFKMLLATAEKLPTPGIPVDDVRFKVDHDAAMRNMEEIERLKRVLDPSTRMHNAAQEALNRIATGLSDGQARQLSNLQRYLEQWYKENVAAVNEDGRTITLTFAMRHKGAENGNESFLVNVTSEDPY